MRLRDLWANGDLTPAFRQVLTDFKPDIIYMDIGTNDLASLCKPRSLDSPAQRLGIDMLALARFLITEKKLVRSVYWGSILPRRPDCRKVPRTAKYDYQIDLDLFERRRSIIGEFLKLEFPLPGCHWVHTRIEARNNYHSPDGTHLNHKGMNRYYYSVRATIIQMSHHHYLPVLQGPVEGVRASHQPQL